MTVCPVDNSYSRLHVSWPISVRPYASGPNLDIFGRLQQRDCDQMDLRPHPIPFRSLPGSANHTYAPRRHSALRTVHPARPSSPLITPAACLRTARVRPSRPRMSGRRASKPKCSAKVRGRETSPRPGKYPLELLNPRVPECVEPESSDHIPTTSPRKGEKVCCPRPLAEKRVLASVTASGSESASVRCDQEAGYDFVSPRLAFGCRNPGPSAERNKAMECTCLHNNVSITSRVFLARLM